MTLLALAWISGCTTGSAVVFGEERSPVDPGIVTLYAEDPAHYELVGTIEAASTYLYSTEAGRERALVELKEQAARIGANGVMRLKFGETMEWVHNPSGGNLQKTITARGIAIYVTSTSQGE